MTGAHAFKVGFSNSTGSTDYDNWILNPVSYRLNNGVPNQLTRKPVDEVNRLIESGRRKMIEARRTRPAPTIDRNILTDWNGMMVSSYLKAYETLGHEGARAFALRTLDFILKRSFDANAGLSHGERGMAARRSAHAEGADDQAFHDRIRRAAAGPPTTIEPRRETE